MDIFIVSWRMIYRWPLFINREFIHDVLLWNHVFQPSVDCLIMEQKQICSFALTSYVASFGYSLCTWGRLDWFHYVYLFIYFCSEQELLFYQLVFLFRNANGDVQHATREALLRLNVCPLLSQVQFLFVVGVPSAFFFFCLGVFEICW